LSFPRPPPRPPPLRLTSFYIRYYIRNVTALSNIQDRGQIKSYLNEVYCAYKEFSVTTCVDVLNVDAGTEAASHNHSSVDASVLALWLTVNFQKCSRRKPISLATIIRRHCCMIRACGLPTMFARLVCPMQVSRLPLQPHGALVTTTSPKRTTQTAQIPLHFGEGIHSPHTISAHRRTHQYHHQNTQISYPKASGGSATPLQVALPT
jgi:hypothetical protein